MAYAEPRAWGQVGSVSLEKESSSTCVIASSHGSHTVLFKERWKAPMSGMSAEAEHLTRHSRTTDSSIDEEGHL